MRPEYNKLIMADSMLAAAALIVFIVWGWQAAVCILFSALVLSSVFVSEIRRREAQASSLSDEIDRILYGEEHWNLDEYSEGELAILQDKVRKLVIRLRDQADQLQKEKNFQAEMMADISHQLKTLKDARLVKSRREGKSMLYSLDDLHVFSILEQVLTHVNELEK